ncbi:pectate lyase [Chromatiaceae bacterium AAb-1]|nr:pectate lyase [Chromatiaceae bacterium AAb-1]
MWLKSLLFIAVFSFALHTVADEWQDYYQRSAEIRVADQAFIARELTRTGLSLAVQPQPTRHFGFEPDQPHQWFLTDTGRQITDSIVSLQTPSGGWSKRTDMTILRQPGQAFGVEAGYIPTFDNSATTTQLRVLARGITVTGNKKWQKAFYQGVQLIFNAQYPHGGWPQNYPLTGGYHDHITLNDEVTSDILELLYDISGGEEDFAFVTPAIRQQAAAHFEKGLTLILELQQQDQDGLTLWAAQYQHRSLTPAWARAYEMPALAVAESAELVEFLLRLPEPSERLQHAIRAAVRWFQQHSVYNVNWDREKRVLLPAPGAGPIWPRFAELETNRAIFGDRDHQLYYDVHQVSLERRQGYAWYTDKPAVVLSKYAGWEQQFSQPAD